jgi:hypothetical protein
MKKNKIIFLLFATAACSVKTYLPAEQSLPKMQQKVPNITLQSAQEGYKVYESACAGCHHLYEPAKFTIRQWNDILVKMFPKAKVSDKGQQKLLTDYLYAMSK